LTIHPSFPAKIVSVVAEFGAGYENAKGAFGMSRKTYARYMKTLSEAGVSWQTLPGKGVYYLGFDTDMAPVLDSTIRAK
jgi:predicted DNA-binding transcriptional regulator YafY